MKVKQGWANIFMEEHIENFFATLGHMYYIYNRFKN